MILVAYDPSHDPTHSGCFVDRENVRRTTQRLEEEDEKRGKEHVHKWTREKIRSNKTNRVGTYLKINYLPSFFFSRLQSSLPPHRSLG